MSNNKPSDQSTSLHLGKFAPDSSLREDTSATSPTIAVRRAAKETVKQGKPVTMPKDTGELPAESMLGAVSYCYAKGVYSSEEIEERMLRDAKLREATHGDIPRASAIRRFRMLNRDAIRSTLEKAFGFMRKRAGKDAPQTPAQPLPPKPIQPADEGTITVVRREVNERLDQAGFIDNMSKE